MAKLRVPSLQHLARNWKETPDLTRKALVNLALHPPTWGYRALFGAVHDMLVLKVSYEQIVEGIRLKVRREDVRENLLELLPLIRDHFETINPDFVQTLDSSYYAAGKGLLIPFEPPLVYGINGQIILPWFSFWRSNPLAAERLSLFVTLAEEMLLQMPDFEEAKFQILDFSIPAKGKPRELKVIDTRNIPRLPEQEKIEKLRIFAEGFFAAQAELASMPDTKSEQTDRPDPNQPSFL